MTGLFSHSVGNVIIPIDVHIFQRGSNHQPDFWWFIINIFLRPRAFHSVWMVHHLENCSLYSNIYTYDIAHMIRIYDTSHMILVSTTWITWCFLERFPKPEQMYISWIEGLGVVTSLTLIANPMISIIWFSQTSIFPRDPSTFLGSVWGIIYYSLEG